MIENIYKNIDNNEDVMYNDYFLSLNGSFFKKILDKDILYNQKSLTPFYMWTISSSIESSPIVTTFDQFKYIMSSSDYQFNQLSRNNKNTGNQKIYFHSASVGYVLSDKSLRYDTQHTNVLYYYGYGNRFGYGSPFNRKTAGSSFDIPTQSKQISPTKLAYASIKNILSDENYIKNNKIQLKESYFIDDFVYIKIPRRYYHEEILKGSFEITLASGSARLDLADIQQYNIFYNEENIVYLVSASNQTDVHYVSGNLDIYGLLDRKNAIALIDVNRLNSFFGTNTFVTTSITEESKSFKNEIYQTQPFGVVTTEDVEITPYKATFYPNLEKLSLLLYSGSMYKPMKAIGLETQISDQYHIKIGVNEFNKSTNPTYVTNWKINPNFVNNPITYITTIGLYNDTFDCLAVAKLSKPLRKEYDSAFIIKVEIKQ